MRRMASANHSRSCDTLAEPIFTGSFGKMGLTLMATVPTRSLTSSVMTTMTPMEATALATTGALRKRSVHHDVEQEAEDGAEHHRHRDRGPEVELGADVDVVGQCRG